MKVERYLNEAGGLNILSHFSSCLYQSAFFFILNIFLYQQMNLIFLNRSSLSCRKHWIVKQSGLTLLCFHHPFREEMKVFYTTDSMQTLGVQRQQRYKVQTEQVCIESFFPSELNSANVNWVSYLIHTQNIWLNTHSMFVATGRQTSYSSYSLVSMKSVKSFIKSFGLKFLFIGDYQRISSSASFSRSLYLRLCFGGKIK